MPFPGFVAVCLCVAVFWTGLAQAQQVPAAPRKPDAKIDCRALADARVADVNLLSATPVDQTDSLPAYCRVLGYVRPAINFELRLPLRDWNEKFYMVGCGGFCGKVESDLPGFTNAMNFGLRRGYAAVAMDGGHFGRSRLDGVWAYNNRQAEIDFGHRAAHAVAAAAKALIGLYYPEDLRYSYFAGCSTGGRMGLMQAQRHPEDFDGIIAGAPAHAYTALVGSLFAWMVQANRDDEGAPILREDRIPAIAEMVLGACDVQDGLRDGLVSAPGSCDFDPMAVVCGMVSGESSGAGAGAAATAQEGMCLQPEEAEAMVRLYDVPKDGLGQPLYPGGVPRGSETYWPLWLLGQGGFRGVAEIFNREFLRYMAFDPDPGELIDAGDFDFERDPPELERIGAIMDATDPGLDGFRARNGRMILYHGLADALVPPSGTTAYYDAAAEAAGGKDVLQTYARLFLVPGMDHCGIQSGLGPDEFDPLTALEAWVETNTPPEQIVARQRNSDGDVERTRPLCAYPATAQLRAGGRPSEHGSFECVTP